jgi:hypothetical protein
MHSACIPCMHLLVRAPAVQHMLCSGTPFIFLCACQENGGASPISLQFSACCPSHPMTQQLVSLKLPGIKVPWSVYGIYVSTSVRGIRVRTASVVARGSGRCFCAPSPNWIIRRSVQVQATLEPFVCIRNCRGLPNIGKHARHSNRKPFKKPVNNAARFGRGSARKTLK